MQLLKKSGKPHSQICWMLVHLEQDMHVCLLKERKGEGGELPQGIKMIKPEKTTGLSKTSSYRT